MASHQETAYEMGKEEGTEAERERCAKIAEAFGELSAKMGGGITDAASVCAHRIAEAIRAQSTEPQKRS